MAPTTPGRRPNESRLLPDLQALLECLQIPVDCPHCGHRCGQVVGWLKSDGVYTCAACGQAALVDSSRMDVAVAAAAGKLQEQALDLGRSIDARPATEGIRTRPTTPRGDA